MDFVGFLDALESFERMDYKLPKLPYELEKNQCFIDKVT